MDAVNAQKKENALSVKVRGFTLTITYVAAVGSSMAFVSSVQAIKNAKNVYQSLTISIQLITFAFPVTQQ